MTDSFADLPTGSHHVCPHCGAAVGSDRACSECGFDLSTQGVLPTADDYTTFIQEQHGLGQESERRARLAKRAARAGGEQDQPQASCGPGDHPATEVRYRAPQPSAEPVQAPTATAPRSKRRRHRAAGSRRATAAQARHKPAKRGAIAGVAAAACAACAAVLAIANSGSQVAQPSPPPPPVGASQARRAPVVVPARQSAAGGAEQAVRGYWSALQSHNYGEAFGYLSPGNQASLGGYPTWLSQQQSDQLSSANVQLAASAVTPSSATLKVVSLSTQGAQSGCRNWSGSYQIVRQGRRWLIESARLVPASC